MRNKWIQLLKGQIALWLAGKHTEPQKWIFSSVENREFNYNSKYLFLYVKEHFPQIEPYYVVNDEKNAENWKRHMEPVLSRRNLYVECVRRAGQGSGLRQRACRYMHSEVESTIQS